MLDYREMISRELERRKARNPLYSLRALARDIDMPPSRLSEAMNNVRGISLAVARKICKALSFEGLERQMFLLSVEAHHGRAVSAKERAAKRLAKLEQGRTGEPAVLDTMTGWIEPVLARMHAFGRNVGKTAEIADRLGVPEFMVVSALRFLTRLGKIQGLKEYRTYLESQAKGRELRIDYEQVLDKSRSALAREKAEKGAFRFAALMLPACHIPHAEAILAEAFRELRALESADGDARVYFVATQLFPVEKKENAND